MEKEMNEIKEPVVNYVIKVETPKGAVKTVKVHEGQIGITAFKKIASEQIKKVSVAKVFAERTVNGVSDGNGIIMRYAVNKSTGDGAVILPKGSYHNIDKATVA